MEKRLAINTNGELTYCKASDENIGKGRCNHLDHKMKNESVNSFLKRAELKADKLALGLVISPKDQESTPIVTVQGNGVLHINQINDLSGNLQKGVQAKGFVAFNNGQKFERRFLKLDRVKEHYIQDSNMTKLHPSITENLSTSLANYLFDNENFHSSKNTIVQFKAEDVPNEKILGLLSKNYLGKGKTEVVLASDNSKMDKSLITNRKFERKILKQQNNDKRLKNMISLFNKAGVDKDKAKEFILRQNALDIVLGNNDRQRNGGNYVFIRDSVNETVEPFNADLGITLMTDWQEYTETDYKMKETKGELTQEYKDSNIENDVRSILYRQCNGLFKGNLEERVNFLLDNGFEPIEYNKDKVISILDREIEKTNNLDGNFKYYLENKRAVFLKILEDENIKKIMKEV